MSRKGKKPVQIPENVEVSLKDTQVEVKGPKGKLLVTLQPGLQVEVEGGQVKVTPYKDDKSVQALWGLTRVLIANAIEGVTKGFEKRLEIIGVGYRAQMEGRKLKLNLGYSHPVVFDPPEGIEFAVEEGSRRENINNRVIVRGISKQKVGDIAASIRSCRPPEPYKGKGIRYEGEYVRKKAGKTTA